jgi:nicotinate-nucleotide adenylyltransferase
VTRLGVFGGSFNPVHWGHLHVALLARERVGIDRVLFVPAARPPHKDADDLAPAADRVAMLRGALRDEADCEISEVELLPGGPRYTVETLSRIRDLHPGAAIAFVMGLDSLRDLPGWRDPERILAEFGVVVVDRPGCDPRGVDPGFRGRVTWVDGNPFAISSSAIRGRVAAGLPIHHLVPPSVARHVAERGLYRKAGAGTAS